MLALFADLPEAIENTGEIAQRCSFMVSCGDPILPKFADDEVAELRRQANEGLHKRLEVIPHAVSAEDYQKRLDFELTVIINMGFLLYTGGSHKAQLSFIDKFLLKLIDYF